MRDFEKPLTENQQQLVDHFKYTDHWYDRPTLCLEDIYELMAPLTVNQVKGIIGSLVKKDILIECELPNDVEGYQLWEEQ